jgi:hypothetical protein
MLIAGIIGLGGAIWRIGRNGFWSNALGGALLAALGLVLLRNVTLGAVTLTPTAGVVFLMGGLARLVAAGQEPESKVPLLLGGFASTRVATPDGRWSGSPMTVWSSGPPPQPGSPAASRHGRSSGGSLLSSTVPATMSRSTEPSSWWSEGTPA